MVCSSQNVFYSGFSVKDANVCAGLCKLNTDELLSLSTIGMHSHVHRLASTFSLSVHSLMLAAKQYCSVTEPRTELIRIDTN